MERVLALPYRTAFENKALEVFNSKEVFKAGTVFLGFGVPNVYISKVLDDGAVTLRAKSLWQAPTSAATSKGNVQKGIQIVPMLNPEQIVEIESAISKVINGTGISCARICTDVCSIFYRLRRSAKPDSR